MPGANPFQPQISKFLYWGFSKYVQRLVRKKFSAIRVVQNDGLNRLREVGSSRSVLVYINHIGWWDPMTAVFMTKQLWPDRSFYAPIDADALEKYRVLSRLGFFPIQRDAVSGARAFLQTMDDLLKNPSAAIWMTPEGRFADARQPAEFQKGLGQAVARFQKQSATINRDGPVVVCAAVEYPFWDESTPELLIEFGRPEILESDQPERSGEEWTMHFQQQLRDVQKSLAQKSIVRDASAFHTLSCGSAGEGGLYDWARRTKAALTGRSFEQRHSDDAD